MECRIKERNRVAPVGDYFAGSHAELFRTIEDLEFDEAQVIPSEPIKVQLSPENESQLRSATFSYPQVPQYFDFVEHIEKTVDSKNRSKNPSQCITRVDVIAISDAWDLYVKQRPNRYMAKAKKIFELEKYRRGLKSLSTKDILNIKKKWLVKGRLETKQISRSSSEELGNQRNEGETRNSPSPAVQALSTKYSIKYGWDPILDDKDLVLDGDSLGANQGAFEKFDRERQPFTTPCGESIISQENEDSLDYEALDAPIGLMQADWTQTPPFDTLGNRRRLEAWRAGRKP